MNWQRVFLYTIEIDLQVRVLKDPLKSVFQRVCTLLVNIGYHSLTLYIKFIFSGS